MKVLIITYYWPPAGGSGVQRWLKFVKYLQNFDIEPVVYTADEPEYALTDQTLLEQVPEAVEILKQPIWEPNNLLSKIKSGQQQTSAGFLNSNPSFFAKKLHFIRANYFIPDARKFWIKPSVKYLTEYLKNNKIDVVISTGPPHSMHLIGLALKNKFPVKWIADFRDPWTDIDYFHQLPLTARAKKKHFDLEQKVLKKADAVLVVGKTMQEKYKKCNKNVHVITNGFDTESEAQKVVRDRKFSLTHIGLMNADRNPKILWEVLSELVTADAQFAADLSVKLVGKVAEEVRQSIRENKFESMVQFIDYLPYQKVMQYQRSAQVLLLAVNRVPAAKGIITGKIFEYLQAKRPILAIAPTDGDLAEILNKTKAGTTVDFDDKVSLKNKITALYQQYKAGDLKIASKNIAQYHRKKLTQQLAELISNLK